MGFPGPTPSFPSPQHRALLDCDATIPLPSCRGLLAHPQGGEPGILALAYLAPILPCHPPRGRRQGFLAWEAPSQEHG